jgi:hypothetical protein
MLQRFMAKVSITPKTDCWLWQATKNKDGYGHFGVAASLPRKAHRVSYEMFCEEIPAGKIICHRCDNPSCVNPDHLFVGSHADNSRDRDDKGRQALGRRNGKSRLSEDDIPEIRASSLSERATAKQFGVHRGTVNAIKSGRTWSHVP